MRKRENETVEDECERVKCESGNVKRVNMKMRMQRTHKQRDTVRLYMYICVYRYLFQPRYRYFLYTSSSPGFFITIITINIIIVIEMYFLLALDFVPLFLYENRFTFTTCALL